MSGRIVINENSTEFDADELRKRIAMVLGDVDVVVDSEADVDEPRDTDSSTSAPTERAPAVSRSRSGTGPTDLDEISADLDGEAVMSVSSGGMWREDVPHQVEQELMAAQGPVKIVARPVGTRETYDWEVSSEQVDYDNETGEFVPISELLERHDRVDEDDER